MRSFFGNDQSDELGMMVDMPFDYAILSMWIAEYD